MSESPEIRILVVEDSATVRAHIVEVLAAEPGFDVVAQASDGERRSISAAASGRM